MFYILNSLCLIIRKIESIVISDLIFVSHMILFYLVMATGDFVTFDDLLMCYFLYNSLLMQYFTYSYVLCLVFAPLPSARQHPSYGDCLEVKSEYYQNSSVLDCVTQCSQSAAHLCEQFLQVKQIWFVT